LLNIAYLNKSITIMLKLCTHILKFVKLVTLWNNLYTLETIPQSRQPMKTIVLSKLTNSHTYHDPAILDFDSRRLLWVQVSIYLCICYCWHRNVVTSIQIIFPTFPQIKFLGECVWSGLAGIWQVSSPCRRLWDLPEQLYFYDLRKLNRRLKFNVS